jgi:hypothetical protein
MTWQDIQVIIILLLIDDNEAVLGSHANCSKRSRCAIPRRHCGPCSDVLHRQIDILTGATAVPFLERSQHDDGIYAGRPAYDTVIQATSGVMDLTRTGVIPVKTGPSAADIMGAEMVVAAMNCAR